MLFCLPFAALPYILALPIFWELDAVLAVGLRALLTVAALPGLLAEHHHRPERVRDRKLLCRRHAVAESPAGARRDLPRTAGVQAAACRWRVAAFVAGVAPARALRQHRRAILLLATSWLVLGTGAWHAFFAATPFIRSILHDSEIGPKLVSAFTGVRLLSGSMALAELTQAATGAAALLAVGWIAWRRPGAGAEKRARPVLRPASCGSGCNLVLGIPVMPSATEALLAVVVGRTRQEQGSFLVEMDDKTSIVTGCA